MKKRMNAGRRRGRIGMAWLHQDASWLAQSRELDKQIDAFLANTRQELDDVVNIALPALESVRPGMGMGLRLAMELSPMFGVTIRSPLDTVRIQHHTAGESLKEKVVRNALGAPLAEDRVSLLKPAAAREVRATIRGAGIPAFMLPRDNGHRISREERARYDELSATNTYVPPERKENRYGAPEWPEGTELVDGRHPDAGEWGKLCYRTACQAPNAFYWNIGSRKHYCQECADIINREGMGGERLLFLSEKEGTVT